MTTLTPKQWIELVHRAGSAEAAALIAALAGYARAGAVTVTARVLSVVTGLPASKVRRLIRRLPGVNVARVGRAGWSFSIEDAVWSEARAAGNLPAEMRTPPSASFSNEMRTPIFDAKQPEPVPAQKDGAENVEKRGVSFSSEMRTPIFGQKPLETVPTQNVGAENAEKRGVSFSSEMRTPPGASFPGEMRTPPDVSFSSEMRTAFSSQKRMKPFVFEGVAAENAEKRGVSFPCEMRTAFSSRKRMEPLEFEGVAAENAEKRGVSFPCEMRTPPGVPFPGEMRTPIFDEKPPEIIPAQNVAAGKTLKTGVSFSGPNGGNFQPAGGAANVVELQFVENQRVPADSKTATPPPDPPSGLTPYYTLRSVTRAPAPAPAPAPARVHAPAPARARGRAGGPGRGEPPPARGQEPAEGAAAAAAGSADSAGSDAAASIGRYGLVFNATPGLYLGTAQKTPADANASERQASGREVGPGKPGAKAVGPSGGGGGGGAPPPGGARAEGRGSGAGPAAGKADGAAQKRPRGKPADTAAARELVARFARLFKRHWNRSYATRAADVTHARSLVRLGVRPGHLEEVLPQVWRYGGYAARASLTVRGVALHWNELQVAAARYKPAARDLTRVTPAVRKMLKDDPEELKRQIAEYGETEEDDDPWT